MSTETMLYGSEQGPQNIQSATQQSKGKKQESKKGVENTLGRLRPMANFWA